jgi:hypothetical protein
VNDGKRVLMSIAIVFAALGIVGILQYGGARADVGPVGVQRLIAVNGLLLAAIWIVLIVNHRRW